MRKRSFSSDSPAITRRIFLTGAVASTSALVLAACGGTGEAGPVPTVTRVPAEGAPPTPTPAPSPGATPAGGAATPAASPAASPATAASPAASPAAGGGQGATVGPLIAVDIGWELGDQATMAGDAITLTVTPGTTVEMINEGAAEHDFTVDALGVHVPAAPGETVEVTIPADAAPGEYEFYCSVPGHKAAGMVGTLVVEEGAAAAPAEAEAGDEAAAGAEEPAAPAAAEVGPLYAIDIGWRLGDLSTLAGDTITLAVNPGATIELINEGAAEHDFVVDTLAIDVDIAPGASTTVTIPEDAALGEYEFYCSVPGHKAAGMVGTLVVEEGRAAPAAGGGEEPAAEEAAAPATAPAADGGGEAVGPLIAVDIGWELGDQSTMAGDTITLSVAPGATVELVSEGAAEHDFVVDALGIDVDIPPGETTSATIPADAAAGEYEFYCSLPGHAPAGMVGTLVVG
jgi:plastocyanin